jgi:hypothetical protein
MIACAVREAAQRVLRRLKAPAPGAMAPPLACGRPSSPACGPLPPASRARPTYIHHHLGLGDHFICNGLVRVVAERVPEVVVAVRRPYLATVEAMFRDLPHVRCDPVADGAEATTHGEARRARGFAVLRLGLWFETGLLPCMRVTPVLRRWWPGDPDWQDLFYAHAGLDPELQYTRFLVPRDPAREAELVAKMHAQTARPYAFVHDDPARGYVIRDLPRDRPVYRPRPGLTDNVLDYLLLIEKAQEVHCIDSSFFCLIDHMGLRRAGLFYHLDARPSKYHPKPRLPWRQV